MAAGDISLLPGLSDANPADYPTLFHPQEYLQPGTSISFLSSSNFLGQVLATVSEAASAALLPSVCQVHSKPALHTGDTTPVRVYSTQGNVANIFSQVVPVVFFEIPKPLWINAGRDVNALNRAPATTTPQWIQNLAPGDVSVIEAGRDIDLNIRVDGPGLCMSRLDATCCPIRGF